MFQTVNSSVPIFFRCLYAYALRFDRKVHSDPSFARGLLQSGRSTLTAVLFPGPIKLEFVENSVPSLQMR